MIRTHSGISVRDISAIKRAAYMQGEINLNDPIKIGYKQLLVNALCEKTAALWYRKQNTANKYARDIISPHIPRGIKVAKTRYPMAFPQNFGVPFFYTGSDGKEHVAVVSPSVPLYFSIDEMSVILMKAKDSKTPTILDKYQRLISDMEQLEKLHRQLRKRQIHYATLLNLPKFNSYKGMLKTNPVFFARLYEILTGFNLVNKYKDL